MIKLCARLVFFLFCESLWSQSPSGSTELKMRADIEPNKIDIRVTFENISQNTILLSVGNIIGTKCHPHVQLTFIGKCRQTGALSSIEDGGVVGARGDPWVVVIPPLGAYSVHFPMVKMVLRNGNKAIDMIERGCTVTASFAGSTSVDRAPGGQKIAFSITRNGPTLIPFWTGNAEAQVTY